MFFCTDVHYDDQAGTARAAAVGFWRSTDSAGARRFVETFEGIEPYVPGEFYRRELPCLLGLLDRVRESEAIDLVIVDGHVWLTEGRPGLGHHLWSALGQRTAIIGVAKAPFADGCAIEVLRGGSTRPLYVTSVGVDAADAAEFVRGMHGPNRLPTLLAEVDALSRRDRR